MTGADWAQAFIRMLGDELRATRTMRGLYRKDLVRLLGREVSLQTVATYEQGSRSVPLVRFVEIAIALDVSPMEILARVYDRLFVGIEHAGGYIVDLVAASEVEQPELLSLRRWAACRLDALATEGLPKTVRLDVHALGALAVLCDMDTVELVRRLP